MSLLNQFGWSEFHRNHYTSLHTELKPGRVISIKGFKYSVMTERGELETELSGKLLYGTESENLPKVGDWVLFMDYESMGYLVDVLPRMNALSRKNPGAKVEKQVLATNIDRALIVQGLDRDFNVMRLERYLVQMSACNIAATIVLNKADLVQDHSFFINEVARLQRPAPVIFCSTVTGEGMKTLNEQLEAGKTYIFIGSSGVGKSSLLNRLLETELQTIGSVSDFNNKGKHTTTSRDLFQLANGALVIDTPGMREFGVTHEDGANEAELFPAIQTFASRCKYSDCKHINEDGCAVLIALEIGELDHVVYESYIKLMKEQRRFQITADEKKRLGKQFGKMTKEAKAYRKKYKY